MTTSKATGPLGLSMEESIPLLTILTIIGVTSIATNLLIVGIICKNSQRRKNYDIFILHSSFVDLVTAVVVLPFWILSAVHGQVDFAGNIYCQISATVSLMDLVAPAIFLSLVAACRHCAIVDRKAFPRIFSEGRSRLIVMLVWFLVLLISIPPHFSWQISTEVLCLPDLISNSWYTTTVLVFCLILPLSAGFYSHIDDIFLFQRRRMKRNDTVKRCCARVPLRGTELSEQKTLFGILIIHTFCWFPYIVAAMAQTFNGGQVLYTGKLPVHFISLVVGLTGIALKAIVLCFEVPHLKKLIRKQFGCIGREENPSQDV